MYRIDTLVPVNQEEKYQIEIFSYYASFWMKTSYSSSLGEGVTNIVCDVRKKIEIN